MDRSRARRMPSISTGRAPAQARPRPACRRCERTIWWQKALASISKRSSRRRPRSSHRGRQRPGARATARARPATGFGRRQNDEKSCSPMNGSQASAQQPQVERRGRRARSCAARNGSGTRSVQHRVPVAAPDGREAGVEVGRGHLGRAHHDRGPAQPFTLRCSRPRGRGRRPARRSDTTWPQACTPVSVRPAHGQLDRMAAAPCSDGAASAPATVATPAFAAKPWKPDPS